MSDSNENCDCFRCVARREGRLLAMTYHCPRCGQMHFDGEAFIFKGKAPSGHAYYAVCPITKDPVYLSEKARAASEKADSYFSKLMRAAALDTDIVAPGEAVRAFLETLRSDPAVTAAEACRVSPSFSPPSDEPTWRIHIRYRPGTLIAAVIDKARQAAEADAAQYATVQGTEIDENALTAKLQSIVQEGIMPGKMFCGQPGMMPQAPAPAPPAAPGDTY